MQGQTDPSPSTEILSLNGMPLSKNVHDEEEVVFEELIIEAKDTMPTVEFSKLIDTMEHSSKKSSTDHEPLLLENEVATPAPQSMDVDKAASTGLPSIGSLQRGARKIINDIFSPRANDNTDAATNREGDGGIEISKHLFPDRSIGQDRKRRHNAGKRTSFFYGN